MRINIEFNQDDLNRVNLLLSDIDAANVMRRAINTTLDGVRTDATRAVYQDLNLTQARIRENFRITRALSGDISGVFSSRGRPINLASFVGTRVTTRGLSVKVKRQGDRTILRHAFLWSRTARSGDAASTAFQREYQGPRTRSSTSLPWKSMNQMYRLPLETLQGPRIEDVLSRPDIIGPLEENGGVRLETNVDRELTYILSRHQ